MAIRSVTVFRPDTGEKRLYALVRAVDDGRRFDARVLDRDGTLYVSMEGYQTVPLPGFAALES